MADFDQFASAEPPQTEEDPAAAFLAREQDELAGLEDEDASVPADSQQEEEPAGDAFAQPAADAGDFDPFSAPAVEPSGNLEAEFGGLGLGGAEDMMGPAAADAGDLDPFGIGPAASDLDPYSGEVGDSGLNLGQGFDGDIDRQIDQGFDFLDDADAGAADPYGSVRQVDTQRAEPEKIRIWREEQKDILLKKDEASEVRKEEWREIAAKELEDWYRHRDEQLEKTKKNNREAEAEFCKERDENVPGHEWERICRLCDFNPKNSRNTKDTARMRSILLQLKQTPLIKAS